MSHVPEMKRHEHPVEFIVSVGWLHPAHPFSKGCTSPEFQSKLAEFVRRWVESIEALDWGVSCGYHTCEFCSNFSATGSFGVLGENDVFSAPTMIAHYVEGHEYFPPSEFIDAVMKCPLPGTPEYATAAAKFTARYPSGD